MTDKDCELLDVLLKEVECNFPSVQFYIDKSNKDLQEPELTEERKDSLLQLAVAIIEDANQKENNSVSPIISDIMESEPFCHYQELRTILLTQYCHED